MSRRVLIWLGTITGAGTLLGLAVYLSAVGLDSADKVASVIGLFVALIGLVLSAAALWAGRAPEPGPAPPSSSPSRTSHETGATPHGGPVQNITSSAQGAMAQGVMFGNIINHPTAEPDETPRGETPGSAATTDGPADVG